MVSLYVWLAIVAVVFVAGLGIGYVAFQQDTTVNPMMMNQQQMQHMVNDPQQMAMWQQTMMDNPDAMEQWMNNPQHVRQMTEMMSDNHDFMMKMMTEMIDDPNIRVQMLGHMSENHETMEQMREMMDGNMMGGQMMGNMTMNHP